MSYLKCWIRSMSMKSDWSWKAGLLQNFAALPLQPQQPDLLTNGHSGVTRLLRRRLYSPLLLMLVCLAVAYLLPCPCGKLPPDYLFFTLNDIGIVLELIHRYCNSLESLMARGAPTSGELRLWISVGRRSCDGSDRGRDQSLEN